MSLTPYERETHFNWNEEEDFVSIYTASKKERNKCIKLGLDSERDADKDRQGNERGWFFELPLNEFRWGKKRVMKPLTPEQKEKLVERLNQNRLSGSKTPIL